MALPSVTIGGNTQYMNPGIQPGTISYGGSVMMPQTAYGGYAAAPMTTYGTSTVMPQTTYTTAAPVTTYAAPMAAETIVQPGGGSYVIAGTDFNRDGIPDAMETPVTYVTQAPAMTSYAAPMTSYAAPMTTTSVLPTTASMVAYPQTTGPFVFYAAEQMPAVEVKKAEAKRDVKVAKKKKGGCCGFCAPAKKAPAKKK